MNKIYLGLLNRRGLLGKTDSCSDSPQRWRISVTNNLTFIVLLFSLLLSSGFGFAQTISNYAFAAGTNGSLQDLSVGNTSYLVGNNDDNSGTVQIIGFDFFFMGTKYTHFSANSNGQMMLHTSSAAAAIGTNVTTTVNSARLAPFTGDNEVANGMRFKVVGTAPNRTFVLEWNQFYINYQNLTNAGNMQVWLEETTGKVTYMYGEIFNSATSAQTRSILIASSNTATTVGSVTIGAVPLFTAGTTLVTNSIAAGANPLGSPLIANIGSAADGSRVFFTFTPPTAVLGDVAALTYSSVTGNGTTLDWVDNATNEFGFLVTRATDAAFTQNVTIVNVASTTSVGTGMAYTSVQTGLTPSTNYYYKVVALVEAGQSTGQSGSQMTLPPGNVSAIATGLWSETTTWSTSVVPTATDIVVIPAGIVVTEDITAAAAYTLTVQGDLVFTVATARTLTVVSDVTISAGASLKSAATGTVLTHSLVVGGSLTNNGTLDFSTNAATAGATITFNTVGNANFTLGGASVTNLRNTSGVTLNKGTNITNVLTFNPGGILTVQGANALGFMSLTNGLLKLDGTNTFNNPLFSSTGYTIPLTAGYWQNNPNATVVALGGSPTVTGLFRLSSGTFNIGTLAGNSMGFSGNSTILIEGGTINAASRFGVGSSGNLINYTQTAGTINVNQVGNISTTLASFDLGTNANSVITFTGGTVNVVLAGTAASGPRDVRGTSKFNPNFVGTGMINFGTAASGATPLTYFISGAVPALTISTDSAIHNLSVGAANTQCFGNVTIPVGSTFNLNGFQFILRGSSLVNNGTLTGTTTGSSLYFFGGATPQSYSGTGVCTEGLVSLTVDTALNTFTLAAASSGLNPLRVNLFSGNVVNSNKITIGTGLALATVVQIGVALSTVSGGSFDVAPTWNLGTGLHSLIYAQESVARTSGFEVNPTRVVNGLVVDNTNGVTIAGGDLTAISSLALTNGIVTTGANALQLGNATTVGTLTGGSATAYVNGSLTRSIADANSNATFVAFPIGKSGTYTPLALAPATTSIALFKAESFASNTGTADASIVGLSSTRRFQALPVSGTFTDVNVRLSDAGILATSIPVQAPTAAGIYSSAFGSTAIFAAGPPVTLTSTTPVSSANYTGYLSFANSNLCMGTPTPGSTIASANAICLGQSVTLSLQNVTSGAGVTYQWKSSTDGISYANVAAGIMSTLMVTPSATTFYLCEVTCTATAATTNSTAVQITFGNNVVSTTPAARCGQGTVALAATPSPGAAINWYAASTGGAPLATGTAFETPNIAATTTYYVSAATASTGNITIGTGTALTSSTSQNGIFCNYWATGWRQMVYTATELAAAGLSAGNITSLTFNIATLPSPETVNNFAIRLGSTANSTLTAFTTTGLSSAFGPANYTTVIGLNTITLTTPYAWDGVSNILIDIREDGQYASANSQTFVTTTATNTVVHGFASGSALNPAYYTSNPTPTATNTRPNVIFNGQVACSSERVPVVATITTPPVLTLNTATLTICNNSTSSAVTVTSNVADYDTYVWSPSTGVSGTAAAGWVFNPTATTTYTLTASQSTGSLCVINQTVTVTVNPIPTPITLASEAPTVCTGSIQELTANGGTIGSSGSTAIGVATTLTTENNTDPTAFNNRYKHYWLQMVFTQAELIAAGVQPGNVNGIKFQIASIGSAANVTDFRVSLGSTAVNTLTGFIPAGLTELFSTPIYTQAIGTNSIVFNTPYIWDGTSNIIVDIRSTGVDLAINSQTFFTATTDNKTVSAVTSTTFANSNAFAASNPAGTLSLKRLNTTFDWTSSIPTAITWAPATNLFSDAAATVPYVNGANANTVYFKSSTAAVTDYTATATTGASCTSSVMTTVTNVDCGIPYVNLQFPGTATITTCETQTYYAQVYKAGVTEAAGQAAGIEAWIGRNATNTNPATWSQDSWQLATFNVQAGNNDEYQSTFAASAAGTYYVASRFKYAPGNFVYGGYTSTGGGTWDGITNLSGVLTVNAVATPTASAQTFCNAGMVADLVATGTGVQWYAGATGGTALAGTTALATGTYYVSQTISGCESPRTMVAVTINVTAAPTASAQTFCNGLSSATVADLVATGTGVQWYAAATGGTALAGTTALATGDYYVSQTIAGCESQRVMVAITVNVTAAPSASAQTFCNSGTVADLMATGTGVQWYAAATGGTALAGTTALATGTYYVSQTISGCESPRTMVAVTVNVTAAPTASAQTFCNGLSSATVADLMATGTGVQWYAAATGGTALAGTTALSTGNYFVSQTLAGCESTRTSVAVTVNVTTAPTAVSQSFCGSATVANLVTTSGTGIQWYNFAFGGSPLASTEALVSGDYYVSQTVAGCESQRTMVSVTVGTTLAPTGVATQDFTTGQTLADFVVVGQNIIWYSAATGGTVLPASTLLVSGTVYYASQTIGTCESTTRLVVTAGVNLNTPSFEISNLRYYPNQVQDVLTVDYSEVIEGVQMYNMLGQMVYNRNTDTSKVTIDMAGMATGSYILQVTVKGITKNVKVIKK
jgi:hypothetical protein